MSVTSALQRRTGGRPKTTPATPHRQLDQNAPEDLQEELWRRMAALDHVRTGDSAISLVGTRAVHLNPSQAGGPPTAFAPGTTEFAHLHRRSDGSLHITLPEAEARKVIAKEWGELHPVVKMGYFPPTLVMVYGPRNTEELETVWSLVRRSYEFALGRNPS
ncbi:luciferase family protein [Thermomonospora umbrina]|uniref:Luciferase domain-containing protein n=1 Tax=Thermomonospora umbrina TaxID=111806 RepID=A0A3D9SYD1_9ACTN|nr:luciferase family protein [Thermomonospora umbrina]REF00957.1 hypothetical protein DFJ69_6555 [Thermomonospora umbrina]